MCVRCVSRPYACVRVCVDLWCCPCVVLAKRVAVCVVRHCLCCLHCSVLVSCDYLFVVARCCLLWVVVIAMLCCCCVCSAVLCCCCDCVGR